MHILDQFKQQETFVQMELADKLLATVYVIMLGMGITFVALCLIWALTVIMSKVIQRMEQKPVPKSIKNEETVAPTQMPLKTAQTDEVEDDEALIAVITAAIAATLGTTMHNIHVSNIRRVTDQTPAWGQAGRSEVMGSRF